jgi:hypothetical protein
MLIAYENIKIFGAYFYKERAAILNMAAKCF